MQLVIGLMCLVVAFVGTVGAGVYEQVRRFVTKQHTFQGCKFKPKLLLINTVLTILRVCGTVTFIAAVLTLNDKNPYLNSRCINYCNAV